MNRHSQWVYRTLEGILGNQDVAREAMQDTFLKAFQHSLDLRAVRSFRHGL
jgi:DNA-directed RNA polymerase specialized sigma24 family protein